MLICTLVTSTQASVTVWCAFSVIKRNYFPQFASSMWYTGALPPLAPAWGFPLAKRLECDSAENVEQGSIEGSVHVDGHGRGLEGSVHTSECFSKFPFH